MFLRIVATPATYFLQPAFKRLLMVDCWPVYWASVYYLMHLSVRQPVNPRTRQQPQQEASPQEPEEPEEILGSDDEEQEDPHDYCKGELLCYFALFCVDRNQRFIQRNTCRSVKHWSLRSWAVCFHNFWLLGHGMLISSSLTNVSESWLDSICGIYVFL